MIMGFPLNLKNPEWNKIWILLRLVKLTVDAIVQVVKG